MQPLFQSAVASCGIFSIMNAVRVIHRIPSEDAIKLAEGILQQMPDSSRDMIYSGGTTDLQMTNMLNSLMKISPWAIKFSRKHLPTEVPLLMEQFEDIFAVPKKSCVIIGTPYHWTVVANATRYHLELFDSIMGRYTVWHSNVSTYSDLDFDFYDDEDRPYENSVVDLNEVLAIQEWDATPTQIQDWTASERNSWEASENYGIETYKRVREHRLSLEANQVFVISRV